MKVKIGHAVSNENKKANGGKAGDQTGKEILIQDWYNKRWSAVFRAEDSDIAEKIAYTMEQVCKNNNIGYDQCRRTTLYDQAEKLNWDISKIAEKCNCDCSSLVAVCLNAAGIPVSKNMYTGNQQKAIISTQKFKTLTDSKYLTKPDNLKRGDILLGLGHTAIVVSSEPSIDSAKSFSKEFTGTYKVTASKLNIRTGASIIKETIATIPKDTSVICYGYYTKTLGTTWLYVQCNYNNKLYTGFVSKKYLIK
jgi:hypothetical protein